MPKDNEVDEKVKPVAWQWLDTSNFRKNIPSTAIKEHWNPLYSAATVAELRAEVAENESVINVWRRRCEAAERRVGELENLLGAWYAEDSSYGTRLQAPGHHHQVPGIWDSDNGPIAGKPCAKCALWQQIRSITGADPT